MYKLLAIIGCCIGLVGCETMQQQPQKTEGAMEKDRIISVLRRAEASFKTCQDEADKSELYKKAYEELFFETDESPNKYAMLANKNKPTDEQIELLKQSIPILTKCRTHLVDGYRGTPFVIPTLKYYNAVDAIYIKLLKNEMTIGDANEERVKAVAQRKIDWANTSTELDGRLRAMHDAEVQGRRQAAAAMMPLLMQQQQNQQFQQQMLYQQQMQNINNNRPIFTSPSITNCTRNGNQTNCITQ